MNSKRYNLHTFNIGEMDVMSSCLCNSLTFQHCNILAAHRL